MSTLSYLFYCFSDILFIYLLLFQGAEAVKGFALKFSKENIVHLNSKEFKKMYKLRLLQVAWVKLKGDFKHLSGNLRWLYWHGFPLTYIPAEFQQGGLVAIELKYSHLRQMWKKNKVQI